MSKTNYNPWPLNKIPLELQRKELYELKEKGYKFDDAREVVTICENRIANFFGAPYCALTDCCSHAIFLSLKYLMAIGELEKYDDIVIPNHTYVSVPMQILHCELHVKYLDYIWRGSYQLFPTRVRDAAVTWKRNSYAGNDLMCLSFQIKKVIPTGRMGAVLTDDKEAYDFIKLASYDGRDLSTPYDSPEHVKMIGWHYYATPEDAARTLLLMDKITKEGDYMGSEDYPDVSQMIKDL
jgi:dTDP-4-amino-4,6-dideoxygalactose transaminase